MDVQKSLIEAAAKAGVKWILPTEYAGDGLNKHMVDNVPIFWPKREALKYIEELSKTHEGLKWIGVATNPWMELVSLFTGSQPMRGYRLIDPVEHPARPVRLER